MKFPYLFFHNRNFVPIYLKTKSRPGALKKKKKKDISLGFKVIGKGRRWRSLLFLASLGVKCPRMDLLFDEGQGHTWLGLTITSPAQSLENRRYSIKI